MAFVVESVELNMLKKHGLTSDGDGLQT
jgi:hypothetical protein